MIPNKDGFAKSRLGEIYQQLWESCGEEKSLSRFGKSIKNLKQLFTKTHFKESISLVKHNVLDFLNTKYVC